MPCGRTGIRKTSQLGLLADAGPETAPHPTAQTKLSRIAAAPIKVLFLDVEDRAGADRRSIRI